jgi:FdhD protein
MTSASRRSNARPSAPAAGNDAAPVAGTRVSPTGERTPSGWYLAAETPLALLYDGESFGVLMLTPSDLEDFAIGFSLTEGIVRSADEIREVRITEGRDGYLANVKLATAISDSARDRRRSILAGSACGICGAQTLEAAMPRLNPVRGAWPTPSAVRKALSDLPNNQPMNSLNRSTHAAAFATLDGTIVLVREDIGRHNAIDKLIGAMAGEGRGGQAGFIVLSSRLSVEMVVKTARTGVPYVASVSAPSALALAKATEAGIGVACAAGDDLMEFGERAAR